MTLQVIRGGVIVQSIALAQHTASMHTGSAARAAADGVASLDGSGDLPLGQVPDTLTGKDADTLDGSHGAAYMKRVPDYDSGCFSLGSSNGIEKTHGLGTRDIIVQVLYGLDDTDCINDAASTLGRPIYKIWNDVSFLAIYSASINSIFVSNTVAATRYFRVLVWKGA